MYSRRVGTRQGLVVIPSPNALTVGNQQDQGAPALHTGETGPGKEVLRIDVDDHGTDGCNSSGLKCTNSLRDTKTARAVC